MSAQPHRIIMIDDEAANRLLCRKVLEPEGMVCDEAVDGIQGLRITTWGNYDLVLLDIDMPGMQGTEVLRQLRMNPPFPHLKIIMLSGRATGDEMARMMAGGSRRLSEQAIQHGTTAGASEGGAAPKVAQERSDLLNRHLLTINHEMEQGLLARDSDLIQARNALVLALAELVGHRDAETGRT